MLTSASARSSSRTACRAEHDAASSVEAHGLQKEGDLSGVAWEVEEVVRGSVRIRDTNT